uniref:Uncharacterized protein n=1 Tax=Picea glauca TaxID=3330 RepID=A0A117NFY0_PICGL|nr:hypothetical protein ABT39_MTgene2040 [Picea glauca]
MCCCVLRVSVQLCVSRAKLPLATACLVGPTHTSPACLRGKLFARSGVKSEYVVFANRH